jgi:hypothetical protein
VERSTPYEAKTEAAHGVSVRNVGTPSTLDSFASSLERKRTETFDVWTPGLTRNFLESHLGRAALKDGAMGAVGEGGRKKHSHEKDGETEYRR